jgi:hypothetical protein
MASQNLRGATQSQTLPCYNVAASTSELILTLDPYYTWFIAHNGVDVAGTTDPGIIVFSDVTPVVASLAEGRNIVLLGGTAIYRSVQLPNEVSVWYFKAMTVVAAGPTFQVIRGEPTSGRF